MSPQNAARAAPAAAVRDPCKYERLPGAFEQTENISCATRAQAPSAMFADAATEYRAARQGRAATQFTNSPASELTQTMRRAFVCECLETVPLDVAHAQAALECGEDNHAFLHMTRIVLAVKEPARTFNKLRAAERAGSKKWEAP
jgi:hypothetical protein